MRNRKHDIEKYLRGELSPADMHALEREALNDPFLAEALEGVEHTNADSFLYDLHQINRSVHDRMRRKPRKDGKVVRIWGWTSAVAATVLLLVVAGFLVLNFLREQPAQPEAITRAAEVTPADSVPVASEPPGPLAFAEEGAPPKQQSSAPVPSRRETTRRPEITPAPIVAEEVPAEAPAERENAYTAGAKRERSTAAVAEESVAFSRPAVADEVIDTITILSKVADESGEEEVVMLSEVVVVGQGEKKKSGGNTSAEPAVGKDAFKRYLAESIQYPQEAIDKKIQGRVTVRFTVSPTGELTGFEVVKGIGSGCDEELIRAIREGPDWQPAVAGGEYVESRVRVRYRFAP